MTTKTQIPMEKVGQTISTAKAEQSVEFIPFGATDRVRLTAAMVSKFIAVPTKSGALPNERDCIRFIMLCRGKRANPFEGDCFLIGYDSQNGPVFSLVCGIELFLKRAEQSEDYDGRESGVIVDKDGKVEERAGSLVLTGEKLIGGWARVWRKNHSHAEYKAVNFSTYDTGRSRWAKDPAGQIEKVALSQALRQAYPTALGGLYTQDEMQRVAETGEGVMEARTEVAMPQEIIPPSTQKQIPEDIVSPPIGKTSNEDADLPPDDGEKY